MKTPLNSDQRKPPAWIFKAANPLVRPLLKSRMHRILSGQLMVLEYAGRSSGKTYTIPIGYFAVDDDEVISFSSSKWWTNLRDGRHVRLLIGARWHEATPVVAEQTEEKATLLRVCSAAWTKSRETTIPRSARRP